MRKFSGSDSSASLTSLSVMRSKHRVFRGPARRCGLETAHAVEQEEVLALLEVNGVGPTLLGPVGVDIGVGEDAEQPRLEVRAFLEVAVAAVRAEVGLLHEILCVGGVARHTQRSSVQSGHERRCVVSERGLISDAATLFLAGPRADKTPTDQSRSIHLRGGQQGCCGVDDGEDHCHLIADVHVFPRAVPTTVATTRPPREIRGRQHEKTRVRVYVAVLPVGDGALVQLRGAIWHGRDRTNREARRHLSSFRGPPRRHNVSA